MTEINRLRDADKKHHFHPTTSLRNNLESGPNVFMEKGEGIYLFDKAGKEYIDGLSSLWNVNVGHGRKELAEVASEQMEKLAYSHSFNGFTHENVARLSEKIASLTPGKLNVSQFTSGGSESNETVIKLIRHYFKLKGMPNKYKIISRYRGYHGVSLAATSATGIPAFREMGGPLSEGFLQVKTPYTYRCQGCKTDCNGECAVSSLVDMIEKEGADTIAAFILEPVQGAGGVIVPPANYIKKVREVCNKYDVLMVADEVITGFGRTGSWFAMEGYGVEPDFMTIAKGITSGYVPLGGVVINEDIHREMAELSEEGKVVPHGYTYSGHPTACAVALRNIQIIEDEGLVENANNMGKYLREGLDSIMENNAIVGNVMSSGLVASLEFVEDKETKQSFDAELAVAPRIYQEALKNGLITRAITIDHTDIVALCPPLTISKDQVDDLLARLEKSIKKVSNDIK